MLPNAAFLYRRALCMKLFNPTLITDIQIRLQFPKNFFFLNSVCYLNFLSCLQRFYIAQFGENFFTVYPGFGRGFTHNKKVNGCFGFFMRDFKKSCKTALSCNKHFEEIFWGGVIVKPETPMIAFQHWLLGVALLTLCIFIHVFGLILMSRVYFHEEVHRHRSRSIFISTLSFAVAALAIACLHTLQAMIWALGYLYLKVMPDFHAAISFSIGAFTTYSSSGYVIPDDYVLLSETQAMNGVMAFGLTTAFLFTLALHLNRNNLK